MGSLADQQPGSAVRPAILDRFAAVRQASADLCRNLALEDQVVQSMPEVSPTKWHLAHTTWFYEKFILRPYLDNYRPLNEQYDYLFNSYYYTAGQMHARPRRGLLSRPTVSEILQYRDYVDQHLCQLLESQPESSDVLLRVEVGVNHEQQHQELILSDIKHVLAQNPLGPAYSDSQPESTPDPRPLSFLEYPGGIKEVGFAGDGFCFDNELPRHRVYVEPYGLGSRPITNAEYHDFIADGGYEKPELWLSDGWALISEEEPHRPLYWQDALDREFTLSGLQQLDRNAPVTHISYYEADAYSRWAGARLPTEIEWELAAGNVPVAGNFADTQRFHPGGSLPVSAVCDGPQQMFGDVWEWTSSPYTAYPGFRPLSGSLGEYNGKFMCSQLVLRGGSCATPPDHIRPSYRNFFYPAQRWQFTGIRLARDL